MKRFLLHQKGFFALLLALGLGMGTAYAYDFSATCSTGQTLYYNIINSTNHWVEITYAGPDGEPWGGYDKPTDNITLPSTVTYGGVTYTVKKIGHNAFESCYGLTGSLTIPNTVTEIELSAFASCTGFTGSLTIQNSVTEIEAGAFYDCHGFTGSLTLSNSLTTIEEEAFYGCSGFTGTLTIPSSVTYMGYDAFNGCTGFTQVNYNATNCADMAANYEGNHVSPFNGCTGTLTIGSNVQRIPAYMFRNCTGFTGPLTLPNSVTTIGDAAFYGTSFNNSLTIPDSVTTLGEYVFAWCINFTGTLTIGNSLTAIPLTAFYRCVGITNLIISNSVTTIDNRAFDDCYGLTSMTVLAETPPTLGIYVFDNVPTDIPVYVPCGSLEAYQNYNNTGQPWGGFTNLQCQHYDAPPYVDDFETSCEWQLINGNLTNQWVWGEAGTPNNHYLYISDDNGTTNQYTINSPAMVYATKLFHFEEGWYRFQYDWLAAGEKNYDYLRVALVPASVTLSAGTSLPSVPSGYFYNNLPEGWIALDGGKQLGLNSDWQTIFSEIDVPTGDYMMVFAWRNDNSVGAQPPAAIDNVSIRPITCLAPVELTAQHVGATQVTLDWTPVGGEDEWRVWLSWDNGNETLYVPYTANTHPFTITGLTAGRTYTANVYAFCGPDNASLSSNEISFTTSTNLCDDPVTIPFVENFDGYEGLTNDIIHNYNQNQEYNAKVLPQCWNYFNNTNSQYYSHFPTIYNYSSYAHSGSNFLFFAENYDDNYTPSDQYVILPETDNVANLVLNLYARINNNTQNSYFEVGVMTDPEDVSTFTEVTFCQPSGTTYTYYSIPLDLYTGNGTYIAIKMPAASNGTNRAVLIDDLSVTENPCLAPTGLTVTDITTNSATLSWTGMQDSYNVRYRIKPYFYDDFENGMDDWTTIRNGEGTSNTDWKLSSVSPHGGNYMVESRSWYNDAAYSVDNWLITPRVTLGGTLSFWVKGDADYPDKYYVCVSTTQPTIDAFAVLGDARYPTGEWTEVIVDLSAYAGQQGYIAIRHQDSDEDYLRIDDFGIDVGSEWSELNGVTTPVAIQDLFPGTTYEWQVRGLDCDGGGSLTEWSEVHSFVTPLCPSDDQCELTFTLTDSYGDSWNDAAINVVDVETGVVLATLANQNLDGVYGEETQTITLAVCDGRELRFEWVHGRYDYECSYTITNANGTVVLEGEGNNSMNTGDVLGTYMVNCNAVVQTIELAEGWNWISTYIEVEDPVAMLQMVETALGENGLNIKNSQVGTEYDSEWGWFGDLDDVGMTNEQMYKILVSSPCTIILEGTPANPAAHPITVNPGWNWIGFPSTEAISLDNAFAGFAQAGDKIRNSSAEIEYDPEWGWFGDFETLEPGQGYMYYSASSTPRVLSFAQFDYVDLGLPSGLLWATCNVGASSPEEPGDLFAWGEITPKDTYYISTYQHCLGSFNTFTKYCNDSDYGYNGYIDNLTTLLPEDDAATANWGGNWRMPTEEEWQELLANTTNTWTQLDGVNCMCFTASNGNCLFLPANYLPNSNWSYDYGRYWSSSLCIDRMDCAWYFSLGYYLVGGDGRYRGFGVRPVRSAE